MENSLPKIPPSISLKMLGRLFVVGFPAETGIQICTQVGEQPGIPEFLTFATLALKTSNSGPGGK